MLDLVFLAVGIFVIFKAGRGVYNETACNIALVVGIIAGVFGCINAIGKNDFKFLLLNVLVMIFAFAIRFAAKHLAKMYNDREYERQQALEEELRRHTRFPDKDPIYTDETFDDEELRFGKGGYTDNNKVSLDKEEIYTEGIFSKSGYPGRKKVSLEKKKVSLDKKEIYTDESFDDEELRFGRGGFTDPKL